MGLFDDVLEEKKPAKAGQSLFADVLEEPKPLGQRVMDVAGRLGERFKIGSVTPVSGGLQAVNEFFDQGMVPLRIAMGKEWSEQYGDPLGFRERAQAAQAVTREALADQQTVAQRTAARPESLGQALTNPVETLDYYGGIGAESAPAILAAMATRRPQAATTLIGATTAGQTYGSGRAQGLTPEQAGTEAAISGVLEAGLGKLPLSEAFSAGARRFVTAPLTEAVTEAATTGAQGSLGTILRDEAYDPNEQLRNAVDAAIVGGAMGLGEATLGGAPRAPQAETGLFDDVLTDEPVVQDQLQLPTPEQQATTLGLASRPVEATPAVSTEQDVPEIQPERRADAVEDARLAELRAARRQGALSPEDTAELLDLTERDRRYSRVAGRRIPGVLNMEARNEAESAGELKPVQAFADADNFKAVNDRLGHEVGDDVIRQMGGLFAEQLGEGNVFHRGGDEFVMQADTPEQLSAAMEAVRNQLSQAVLQGVREDGSIVEQKGVGFSYGAGPTIQEAESAQYQDKSARKAAGLRTDRTPDAGPSGAGVAEARPEVGQSPTDSAAQAVTPTALPVATGGVGTPVVVPGGRPDATITPNAVELAQPSPSTAEQDNGTTQVPSSASDSVGQRPAARPASGVPARGRDAGSPADAGQQRNPPDSGGGADLAAPSNRPDERGRPESGAARRGSGEGAGEESGRGREAQGQAGQEDRVGEEGRREAPESREEGKVTGTKNAVMEAERSREGRDPIVRDARRSNQETVDSAIKTLQDKPSRGAEVVERLRSQGAGAISLEDEAVLLVHKTKLRNQRNEAADVLADPKASDEAKEVARRDWERLEAEIAAIDEASYASGREWGRLGQFRQRMMAEDYSLEAMERKLRAVTEAPLTRAQQAEVKALSKQLEEAQKRLEETQARLADAESVVTYDDLIKAMQQAARTKRRPTLERLREAANESRAALAAIESVPSRKGQSGAAINPAAFYHLARIGAYHIANGVTQIADWTAKMKADLGERFNEFREMLPEVFRASKVITQESLGAGPSVAEAVAGVEDKLTPQDVRRIAEAHIRAGLRGEGPVMEAVTASLQKKFPDITERQVRNLFSEYGRATFPSKDAVKVEMRQLRSLVQLQESITRLEAGQPALKSGPQRDKDTQAIREKRARLNELLKSLSAKARTPEQLASYNDARIRNLNNQIEDLEKQIRTGERPSPKAKAAPSAEVQALIAKRDALKAERDSVGAGERKNESEKKALQRRLDEVKKKLAGEVKAKRPDESRADDAQMAKLKEQLEQQRAKLAGMRKKDAAHKAIENQIAELLQRLAGKALGTTPVREADSAVMADLKRIRDELAQQLRALENPPRDPDVAYQKAREKSLQRQIATLFQRLTGMEPEAAPIRPTDSPQVAELKRIRDELSGELRILENPPKDPEAAYQEMRAKSIQRQIDALQQRITAGDFDKVKKVPRTLTEENQKAAYALEQVKEEFERLRFEAEMAKRTPVQKIFGGVRDAFNLARAYMTSVDLSGLLRQGGFISFGRPLRALKSVPPSLKSFVSEKAEFEANQDIKNRPNAPLYKKFGLELTGIGSGPLTKVEEAYATRWLNKVPWLLGGGVVRGSGRAYTTMLNRIRADSFDAMLASLAKNGEKPTEAEGKAIANYINVATGRGKVGSSNNAGEVLNTVFFAPRLVASRFQLLAGQPLYGGSARTRSMIAQEYARFLIGVSIATVLASMMADEPEDGEKPILNYDPRSADFGKIRFGDTYLDPLAGLAQVTTFLTRIATGETRTSKGDLRPLRDNYRLTDVAPGLGDGEKLKDVKYGGSGADDVLFRFLRSKLAPVPGAAVNTLAGENMIGEPVTPLDTATSMVTPMSVNDIGAIMEEQGIPRGSAITLLGLLGMGVQHRAPKEEKPETAKGTQ